MSELFVRRQVDFQLYGSSPPLVDFSSAVKSERHHRSSLFMALAQNGEGVLPDRWSGVLCKSADGRWTSTRHASQGKAYRNSDVLNEFAATGQTPNGLFFDMQDAVYRTQSSWPTLQYNRRKGAKNSILWPLKGFHDIGDPRFFDSALDSPHRFRQKRPNVVWRGALVGHVHRQGVRTNIQTVIRSIVSGETERQEGLQLLRQLSRFRAVERFAGDMTFDLGLVIPSHLGFYNDCADVKSYVRPHLSLAEMGESRYLLALAGNDVATSFAWGAATSSLVLKEDYGWETFYDGHFFPWVHYVPISSDLGDIEEKVSWCEANVSACVEMIGAANEQARLLCDGALRDRVLTFVASRASKLVRCSN